MPRRAVIIGSGAGGLASAVLLAERVGLDQERARLRALGLGSEGLTFPEFSAATQTIAGRVSAPEALDNLRVLERTQRLLGANVQEALALEVGLLRLNL